VWWIPWGAWRVCGGAVLRRVRVCVRAGAVLGLALVWCWCGCAMCAVRCGALPAFPSFTRASLVRCAPPFVRPAARMACSMKTYLRKGIWLIFQNRVWAERWRHRGGQETAGGDPGRVLLLFFLIGGATAELPCAAKLWPGENKRAPRACSWCSPQVP